MKITLNGEPMDVIKLDDNTARFIINNEWLSQYGMTTNDILDCKPYPAKITNRMFRYAEDKLKLYFDTCYVCEIRKISDSMIYMDIPIKE